MELIKYMLKIAMCIETPIFVRDLCHRLQQCRNMNNTQMNIKKYKDADNLLRSISCQEFDLVFLDIYTPSEIGFAIAEKVKETDSNMAIIFVSSFLTPSIVKKGDNIENIIFLTEPINLDKIQLLISETIKFKLMKDKKSLLVKNSQGLFKIRLSDILYLERRNKSIIIHTKTEEIISLRTMKDYEDQLPEPEFFRCHKSYIVNTEYIVNIQNGQLSMLNEQILTVSRHRRKALIESISAVRKV